MLNKNSTSSSVSSSLVESTQIPYEHLQNAADVDDVEADSEYGESEIKNEDEGFYQQDLESEAIITIPTEIQNSPLSKWRHYFGIIFCLLGCICMSITTLLAKMLTNYHPFNLTVWRYVGNVAPSIPVLIYFCIRKREEFSPIWPLFGFGSGSSSRKEERWNLAGLVTRGMFGGAVTVFRFSALGYISMADVSVITRSTPALVIVLAHFLLGETCSLVSTIAAFLAVSGVCVLARPPIITGETEFDIPTLIGVALSLAALVCSSLTIIITRKLRKLNFILQVFTFGIVGILEGVILSCSIGEFKFPEGIRDIVLTGLLVGLSFVGQVLSVLSVKFEAAGPISIVKTSYVLLAFIWQMTILHVEPDVVSFVGAGIILAGILLIGVKKWVHTLPEGEGCRKKLNCLTL